MSKVRDSLGPVRELLGGLHRSGTALITKGTAMGPLVPMPLLAPILGVFAYLFLDVAVVGDVPMFSAVFVLAIGAIIARYLIHYARFAKEDPDRLQSEKYRLHMEQLEVDRVLARETVFLRDVFDPSTPNQRPIRNALEGETHIKGNDEQPKEPTA